MLNDPLLLAALAAFALAAAWSFGLFGKPRPTPAIQAEPPRLYETPDPLPPTETDPAMAVATNLQRLELIGLARRLTDGAGLKALGDFHTTATLASQQAGLKIPAPAPQSDQQAFTLVSEPAEVAAPKKAAAKKK